MWKKLRKHGWVDGLVFTVNDVVHRLRWNKSLADFYRAREYDLMELNGLTVTALRTLADTRRETGDSIVGVLEEIAEEIAAEALRTENVRTFERNMDDAWEMYRLSNIPPQTARVSTTPA